MSFGSALVAPRFQSGASRLSRPDSEKPVAITLDNNGSVTMWTKYSEAIDEMATDHVAKLLRAKPIEDETSVIVTTGRAFSGAQRVGDFYRNVPVDFWGTTNGFALFINKDKQQTPDWIRGLSLDQQDAGWRETLRSQFKWDLDILTKTMFSVLKDDGFQPVAIDAYDSTRTCWGRPNPAKWPNVKDLKVIDYSKVPPEDMLLVSFYPDGTSVIFERANRVKLQPEDAETHYTQELAKRMHRQLKDQGLQLKLRPGPYRHTLLYDFVPKCGDGKMILLKYLLEKHLPNVKEAITTGDSHFDLDYMRPHRYRVSRPGGQKDIKTSPIQVGEQENLHKAIFHHPRYMQVDNGQLGQGLKAQLKNIGQRLKLDAMVDFLS